jgi:hypothetical protein
MLSRFLWFYSLSSFTFVNAFAAQSLIVTLNNLPASGDKIQLLCDLGGTIIYQSQIDYAPGTQLLSKEIQLPPATGYRLRATVIKGLRKLPLIVASGKTDHLDIVSGVQGDTTIALSAPQATLVRGTSVQGASTVVFRYDDAGAPLQVGDTATLWCSDKNLKINTAGRQILAPITAGSDGRLFASFTVPNSDETKYCQAGYYSQHLTPTDQIPTFVYPDLTTGGTPLTVSGISASSPAPSATVDSTAKPVSIARPVQPNNRALSTLTTGKGGHLERITTSQ